MNSYNKLKEKLAEISSLNSAVAVMDWDQQTYMPPGAAEARAEAVSVLRKMSHSLFTSDEMGKLLEASESEVSDLDPDSDEVCLVRVVRRSYDRETRVPGALVAEEAKTTSLAHEEWVKARKANDFESFRPWLEKIFDIVRRIAEYRGYQTHVYDALLDPFEPGFTTAEVDRVFSELRPGLVELLDQIKHSGVVIDDSILKRQYAVDKQAKICNDITALIGYDFNCGRQDVAAHPFCTSFATTDVRITTRFDEHFLPGSVFASMHEAGHAMYEQGFPKRFDGTPLREGASLGFHESQSRLWENQVGRSREFIEFYFPKLQETFPESLSDVTADQMYLAANKVEPSLIRVEADEVTYNLHIMLRFELEKALIDSTIDFKDLPDAWNSKMEEYIGIVPPNDAQGVLQDVHWSAGIIGYFPTYALGNLISAQLWNKMQQDIPDLKEKIRKGEFALLLNWLRHHVHAHGAKFLPAELIQKITGESIHPEPLLRYLREKEGAIYGIA